jgi:CubicO group peptidase (beta-lactamase class C family)
MSAHEHQSPVHRPPESVDGSADVKLERDMPRSAQADSQPLLDRLHKMLGTGPFAISGGVFAVSTPGGETIIAATGVDAAGQPIDEDSLMPLASASKLATGLLILRLIDRGDLALDEPIGSYLPDAAAAGTPGVTIRRLLSHTAGMGLEVAHEFSDPPGPLIWRDGLQWPGEIAEACLASAPATEPAAMLQYSNIGYGLLGLAAERVASQPFARLLDLEVFDPLGIEAYVDRLPEREPIKVADIPSPAAGTSLEPYNGEMSRLQGSPWAGVTSNAQGLLALVRAYAGEGGLFSPELSKIARSDQTGGVSGGFTTTDAFLGHGPSRRIVWDPCPWGLSVEVQGGKQPHWAPAALPDSFGQIGSSGCLAWCDPVSGVSWAVLGARTTEGGWLLRHGARLAQTAILCGTRQS